MGEQKKNKTQYNSTLKNAVENARYLPPGSKSNYCKWIIYPYIHGHFLLELAVYIKRRLLLLE